MRDINQVIMVGRLTRAAELRYSNNGTAISTFSIASNKSRKTPQGWQDEGHFFDVTFFGKQAEAVNQYLGKGQQVVIEGELHQDRWTDKNTNQNRSKVKIIAQNLQLVGGKGNNGGGNAGAGGNSGGFGQQDGDKQYAEQYAGPEDFKDDIPF